jgi:uncharacterized protein (DUF433 family)
MSERVIVIDREVMNGTPCFRGTRVPFKNLIDYLEGGHSLGEFLRQFPSVTDEMAIQALEEAKDSCSPGLDEVFGPEWAGPPGPQPTSSSAPEAGRKARPGKWTGRSTPTRLFTRFGRSLGKVPPRPEASSPAAQFSTERRRQSSGAGQDAPLEPGGRCRGPAPGARRRS